MGKFEDLLAAAKAGDASALDQIEAEYNTSTLREKAEGADAARQRAEALLPKARRGAFNEAVAQIAEELRQYAKFEDLGDVDPDAITVELLTSKATAAQAAVGEQKLAVAKAAGFETVEAYEQAIEAGKKAMNHRTAAAEQIGGSVSSGSNGTPGQPPEVDDLEAAREAMAAARKRGATKDYALGAGVDELMARSLESQGVKPRA